MKYRHFDRLGIDCSLLGLGCMRFNGTPTGDLEYDEKKAISLIRQAIDGGVTYLDTAYIYLNQTSESLVGKALKDGYRDKVTIATKMPIEYINSYEDMENMLEAELNKLQTDHIDFYLMHGINKEKWEQFCALGADEFFERKKQEGKIRYKCFSFHGSYEDFEYILRANDWDMVQIQYNFMDINNQAGEKGLKLAGELGIPVVIMEGLLGGKLSKAPNNVQALYDAFPVKRTPVEWAFRFLGNYPQIMTILSGCNEQEQIEDNLRIFDTLESNCMSKEELELIDRVRDAYNDRTKIGCTGCAYCMPCPQGVNIPITFEVWNECSLYESKATENWGYTEILLKNNMTPDKCVGCRVCEKKCPQHLNIADKLKEAWAEIK